MTANTVSHRLSHLSGPGERRNIHQSLGPKIGEGATSDVHAWAPGQVIKLYKDGIPRRLSAHEARVTRAVHAASGLAPEVFDEVTAEDRAGIVMEQLDGPTLIQAVKNDQLSYAQTGAILAGALHAVHAAPPPLGLMRLQEYLEISLQRTREALPDHVAAGLLSLINHLSPGDGLCHGDPNPGNVILTANGAKMIDWIAALRAPPAFDLASAHVMLTELAPHVSDDPERPRAVHAAMHAAYAGLSGVSPDALAASAAPYLPLVRALTVLSGAVPAQRMRLVQQLETDFPA